MATTDLGGEVRVRIESGWFRAEVQRVTPVEVTVVAAAPIPSSGVCHLALWPASGAPPIHLQGDVLEVRRAGGEAVARLRYRKLFCKAGREPIEEFVTGVMKREGTEPGAFEDTWSGSYYEFANEVHSPTMAMIWRPPAA